MRAAVILALTSSALAVPFGNVIDAMFGMTHEARDASLPDQIPGSNDIGAGSGTGFPFPTVTGIRPTGSGGAHHGHHGRPGHRHHSKSLGMDYQLAPTAAAKFKVAENDQLDSASGTAIPSFSLLNPSDAEPSVPTSTAEPAVPLPTEEPSVPTPTSGIAFPVPTEEPSVPTPTSGIPFPVPTEDPESSYPTGNPELPFPTGGFPFPTGGFPGTGMPGLPTTLATQTRGPRPTSAPEAPSEEGENGAGEGQDWLGWLQGIFGGKHGGN